MDLNAIFAVILGLLLIIRSWLVTNYRNINKGEQGISFVNFFNSTFSPTGFIKLFLVIPMPGSSLSKINILTYFIYLFVITFVVFKIFFI